MSNPTETDCEMLGTFRQDDIIYIKVPYILKDDFRKTFPGCHWEFEIKLWSLPAVYENKLAEWLEIYQPGRKIFERLYAEYEEENRKKYSSMNEEEKNGACKYKCVNLE